jgi:DNA-binding CsgD family transcriptional regulator
MNQSPTDKGVSTNDTLFKKPKGMLLDEQQWLFLKKRYHMTPRELQVAILVCRGFNNDEIAKALRIRQGTVKTHLRNIYRRARVKSKILLLLKFVADVNKLYLPSKPPPIPITEIEPKIEPRFQDIQKKK